MTDGREHQVEAIAKAARQQRPRTPRWLWIVAGLVGLGCGIAFVVVLVSDGQPVPDRGAGGPVVARGTGAGFGAGLALGLAAGIGLGLAIARQLRAHSSRSSP